MSLLELKDVSMAYNGKVMALQHINMSVEKVNGLPSWARPAPARRR